MRNTIPTLGTISWGRRVKPAVIALGLLLAVGFTHRAAAQFAAAGDPPLIFGTNYFVTGDYVVAGAYGMTTNFTNVNGTTYALGTINVPDLMNPFTGAPNTGNTGATSVPAGAQIVAALLYWQTVEKIGVTPGGPGSGQNGFFRPLFTSLGQQQPRYPLIGVDLLSRNTVSFSSGGCTGGSTGKVVRTYRADVRGYLPVDPTSGNVLTTGKYELLLPSTSSTTPITLGATLVFIYRVISPNVPLNSIVIYDGPFAPGGTLLSMTQTVKGFYQASANPVSRLTHIVAQGKSKKMESVYLNNLIQPLPSLYPGQTPFPGFYGSWDNPTWTFPYPGPNPPPLYPANPLQENDSSATTMVVPSSSQMGCVSWGAVIVSTTVKNSDNDGLLDVWKANEGFCDVAINPGPCGGTTDPSWVSLLDPSDHINTGHPRQDVFIQMDHVVAQDANGNPIPNGDFTPDAGAVSMVTSAFVANNHNVHLHITDASTTTGIAGADAIPEPALTDNSPGCNGGLCAYPNQPGITSWREGFEFVENQPLNYTGGTAQVNEANCEANTPPLVPIGPNNCIRRFPPRQRNSHHYVVFGDTLGAANWGLLGGTLTDRTGTAGPGAGVVVQFNNNVTFYTSRGHGLVANDSVHGNGRVTITGAITNPNLNGTHLVFGVTCQDNPETGVRNDCSVSNKALGPYSFTIQLASAGTPPPTMCPPWAPAGASCYTTQTDPRLSVASGQAGTGSGFSDQGGKGTLVTLGSWPLAYQTVSAKAGTLMHELGHTFALLHGGGDNTNCKSNYQSVMNYMFQTKLLGPSGVVAFSSQQLNTLDETSLGPITTTGAAIAFKTTRWYDTKLVPPFKAATITSFAINSGVVTFQAANTFTAGTIVKITGLTSGNYLNGQVLTVLAAGLSTTQFEANFMHADVSSTNDSGKAGSPNEATMHCNGTPLSIADPTTYGYKGGTIPALIHSELDIPWSASSLDANFEGNRPGSEPHPFNGYNDWANTDLRQVGAAGNEFFGSAGGGFVPGGPGGGFVGGGPGGGFVGGGPGGGFVGGGPGGGFVGGGPGASAELDAATAVSALDPPSNLMASEGGSPRHPITLTWTEPLDPPINQNNIYRSSDNGVTFSFLASVSATGPGAQAMYMDNNVACNPTGYQYSVTSVLFATAVNPLKESVGSNTVPSPSDNGLLTGCYTNTLPTTNASPEQVALTDLSFPANTTFVQGVSIPITWSWQDDWTVVNEVFTPGGYVNNPQANTLVAIGPIPHDGACSTVATPPVFLNFPGGPAAYPLPFSTLSSSGNGITFNNNQFRFTWNTTNSNAGCYFFELDLDSGQHEQTATALTLLIFVSDNTPHMLTTALPNGVVGSAYTNNGSPVILQEAGGTGPFQWTIDSGSLPTGISLDKNTGTLSGTPCATGTFNFTVRVTDFLKNFGTQPLTLIVTPAAVPQVNQPLSPESSAPGASGFTLTVNGTGFVPSCSAVLWNGSSRATIFKSATQLTAAILPADIAAFGTASISVANTGSPTSNLDFFQITNPTTAVSLGKTDIATGVSPYGVISADFNGDGKLDLAIANSGDNTVSILLGNVDGTFAAKPTLATGSGPFSLAAGDFNNDGKLDLAVANFASGAVSTVSIFIGNGDGTFKPGVTYAVGGGPIWVATGDFNGDGKLDLAVANQNDHTISVLLGNGDGTFQAQMVSPGVIAGVGTLDVADVAIGDFNGDGKLDLAVTNPSTDQVSILLGNGDGTFQAPVGYSTGPGSHPIAVTAADFNGDGKLDLAVTDLNTNKVAILLGNGDGTFQAQVSYSTTSGPMTGPSAITTGDFNGDGKLDLAITNQHNNSVSVLPGNGDGTFQAPLEFTTGTLPSGVAAGDFNGDGRLDVAVANLTSNTVSIMLQPQVLLVPSALSFGPVAEGASTPAVVNLTNNGPGALTISSIAFGGTNAGDFTEKDTCPTSPNTLAAGLSCTITVTFAPTATGARNATLIVTYPGTGSPQMVNLTGSGFVAAPANLVATPGSPGSGAVTLTWSASPSAAGGYNVYRSTTSGMYTAANKIASAVAMTSFPDSGLASGTTYYYVVTAVDGSGNESPFSGEASVIAP